MNVASAFTLSTALIVGGAVRAQSPAPQEPAKAPQAGTPAKATISYDVQVFGAKPAQAPGTTSGVNWLETIQPYTLTQPYTFFGANATNDGIGATLTQADYSLRAPLNLPDDRGVVVTNVVPNGPAAKVGLQGNDILLALGDKPLDRPEDLTAGLKAALKRPDAESEKPLTLHLLRGGKPLTLKVKPESHVALGAVVEEKVEYFIGVTTNPADETLRSHLELPADTCLIVVDVVADSPAAKAGVAKGDILTAFNKKPLPTAEALKALIQEQGPKPSALDYIRKGTTKGTHTLTPEVRKPEAASLDAAEQDAFKLRLQAMGNHPQVIMLQDLNGVKLDSDGNRDLAKIVEQVNGLMVKKGQEITIDLGNPGNATVSGELARLFTQPGAAPADLSKKIDDLAAQVQALNKAVEELRKEVKPAAEKK